MLLKICKNKYETKLAAKEQLHQIVGMLAKQNKIIKCESANKSSDSLDKCDLLLYTQMYDMKLLKKLQLGQNILRQQFEVCQPSRDTLNVLDTSCFFRTSLNQKIATDRPQGL